MGGSRKGFQIVERAAFFFAWKSVIAREFLFKIDTSLAIATSGLRTNLLFENPPFQKPPVRFPKKQGAEGSAEKKCSGFRLSVRVV